MDNKIALRAKAKSIRKSLDINSLSNSAVKMVRELDIYKTSKDVLIFYPMKFELNFLSLLEDNKNFYLPKVNGENMFVCPFDEKSKLEKSGFNIMEPCSEPVNPEVIDLAIVPALMADKNNYRLGYGGGFYDRFLSANPNIKTIAVVAEALFVEGLPVEDFDVKMDYILKV